MAPNLGARTFSATLGSSQPSSVGKPGRCLPNTCAFFLSVLHSKESETEQLTANKNKNRGVCLLVFHSPTCLFPQSKGKKPPVASNGVMGKGKAPSGQQKKADSAAGVKRTPSSKLIPPSPVFWLWVRRAELGPRGRLPSHLGRWSVPCGGWGWGRWAVGERDPFTPGSFLACWVAEWPRRQPGTSVAAYPSRQSRFSCRLAHACLPVRRFWVQGWC